MESRKPEIKGLVDSQIRKTGYEGNAISIEYNRPVQSDALSHISSPEVSNSATAYIDATACDKKMYLRNCYHEPNNKLMKAPGKDAIDQLKCN